MTPRWSREVFRVARPTESGWAIPSVSGVGETTENRTRPDFTGRLIPGALTVATSVTEGRLALAWFEAWRVVVVRSRSRFGATCAGGAAVSEPPDWLSRTRPSSAHSTQSDTARRRFRSTPWDIVPSPPNGDL